MATVFCGVIGRRGKVKSLHRYKGYIARLSFVTLVTFLALLTFHLFDALPAVFYPREEILEQRFVSSAALRMILHGEPEWIFPQLNLFDDAIVSAPGFCFQIGTQPFDRLVMGAVHFRKAVRRAMC